MGDEMRFIPPQAYLPRAFHLNPNPHPHPVRTTAPAIYFPIKRTVASSDPRHRAEQRRRRRRAVVHMRRRVVSIECRGIGYKLAASAGGRL